MIDSLSQLDLNARYSYADYLTWQFEQFVELFKGKIMPMAAPTRLHQEISVKLTICLGNFLNKQNCGCKVYAAPFDVRLMKKTADAHAKNIYTVVQPDLCVICDPAKLDDKGCIGSPDLIIEIISEGNVKRDIKDKFDLYEENGVREYWLARPSEKTMTCFFLENEKYVYKGIFTQEDTVTSWVLPDLSIELHTIFG